MHDTHVITCRLPRAAALDQQMQRSHITASVQFAARRVHRFWSAFAPKVDVSFFAFVVRAAARGKLQVMT